MAIGNTDTVPAMLTPGEFVIKRDSADMLGLPFLRQLNSVSDNAAHGNIDALIGQAQLANMGGEIVPGYQGGGFIERLKNMLKRKSEIDESEPEKYEYAGAPTIEDIDNVLLDYQKRVERLEKFGKNYLNEENEAQQGVQCAHQ